MLSSRLCQSLRYGGRISDQLRREALCLWPSSLRADDVSSAAGAVIGATAVARTPAGLDRQTVSGGRSLLLPVAAPPFSPRPLPVSAPSSPLDRLLPGLPVAELILPTSVRLSVHVALPSAALPVQLPAQHPAAAILCKKRRVKMNILVWRRRKMNIHRRCRMLRKMYVTLRRIRQKRTAYKQQIFQRELSTIASLAQRFDALHFVKHRLELARQAGYRFQPNATDSKLS